jgi:hypothetical protein
MNIKPGVYYNMPAKEYFAAEGLSNSGMKELDRSPHHYQTAKRIGKEPTTAMIEGSAKHLAILEPDRFDDMVFSHSYKTSKSNAEGQLFLHSDTIAEVKTIATTVQNHPIASGLLRDTRKEISLFWKDPDLDIMCKARIDALNPLHNLIIDIKSCKDASMAAFKKQVANLKYHWQAYWYLTGAEILFNISTLKFVFICIEGAPTYSIAIYIATPQMLLKAEEKIIEQKNIYANCLFEDDWPGYPEEIQELYLPPWA